MMRKYICYALLPLGLWLAACGGNDPEPQVEFPVRLTKSTYIFTRAAGDLKGLLQASGGFDFELERIRYNVAFYKVEYETEYNGQTITASGVVMRPETTDPVAMVSFQHGTVASNSEVPSMLPLSDTQLFLLQALASTGFITAAPDFIGFGASADIMHPYYVETLTASAIIDNLYAAANLAETEGSNFNRHLYLSGYSQGGYATMATHKAIETEGITGMELKASFPAAGGYDVKGVQEFFFEQEVYDQPYYLAYVAQAYNVTYGWNEDMGIFFNEPYATGIPTYFDGSLSGGQINARLNDTVAVLLNPRYLAGADTDPIYARVNTAFAENSPTDWVPQIRMSMYHGDADITVPFRNSVEVHQGFLAAGASAQTVTMTTLPGGTHYTGAQPYLEQFVVEMWQMEDQNN